MLVAVTKQLAATDALTVNDVLADPAFAAPESASEIPVATKAKTDLLMPCTPGWMVRNSQEHAGLLVEPGWRPWIAWRGFFQGNLPASRDGVRDLLMSHHDQECQF
jgi:hypothetical protein